MNDIGPSVRVIQNSIIALLRDTDLKGAAYGLHG